jgi:hypothetical protein
VILYWPTVRQDAVFPREENPGLGYNSTMTRRKIDILFILISLFPLALGLQIREHPSDYWSDFCKDIAVVIISLALVDLLWHLVGGDPVSNEIEQLRHATTIAKQASLMGLAGVAQNSGKLDLGQNPLAEFPADTRQIDLCGYCLNFLIRSPDLVSKILRAAKDGTKVRLLLQDLECDALEFVVDKERLTEMRAVARQVVAAIEKGVDSKRKPEVRLLKTKILPFALIRFDSRMLVTHYMRPTVTHKTPIYVMAGGEEPLFKSYIEEFDALFNDAETPCKVIEKSIANS